MATPPSDLTSIFLGVEVGGLVVVSLIGIVVLGQLPTAAERDRAVHYLSRFADKAARSYALAEAVSALEDASDLVERSAQLRLEQDDGGDDDRLGPVAEDELEQTEMQQLRAPSDHEDDTEAEQQLHRLGAPYQLEQLIEQKGNHEHIEGVTPAEALQEEVGVAQQVAHAATPFSSGA